MHITRHSPPALAALAALGLCAALPHAAAAQTYTVQDLGTLPGGTASYGYGINAGGQMAGDAFLPGDNAFHAVRWTGTAIQDLGGVAGNAAASTHGLAINAGGRVVGYSDAPGSGAQRALLWTGTTVTDLGTLGGVRSRASGINDAGLIVGYSFTAGTPTVSGVQHGFLYQNGVMTDLNSLLALTPAAFPFRITGANGINAQGDIAAVGYGPNGLTHALLLRLVPAPEPPAGAVLALGVLGLGALRLQARRRRA